MIQLLLIALRNLGSHKRRTLLLGGAIAGVTALLVVLMGLSNGIQTTTVETATTLMTGHVNVAGFYKVTAGQSAPVVTGFPALQQKLLQEVPEGRAATLLYGAPDGRRPYDAELRERARRDAAFSYHPVSHVAPAVERLATDDAACVAYVAGGEATIKRVRELLMARGVPRKAIKWERFW